MRDRISLLVMGLCLLGCDSDCENVCEAGQECAFPEWVQELYDCGEWCELQADVADVRGCHDLWQNYYDCVDDGQRDECFFVDPCSAESAAYHACMDG